MRADRAATTRWWIGLAACVTVAGCAVDSGVETERAMRVEGELRPDRDTFERPAPGGVPVPGDRDDGVSGEPVDGPATAIAWGPCDDFGIPDPDWLGSERWECGRLEVPMNPADPDGDLPPVSLALTRHEATGDRFGSILLNPGGPGGAGLPLAWGLRPSLPAELLRGFDIVAWDPRGVGRSEPAMSCPADAAPDDLDYIRRCVESTGPLSAFVAAPYSAEDMEEVRAALGEDRLDFLGYSYGSILGSIYAARYPDHVGSFVLDGATDPDVGSPDGPFGGGFPTYADDGFPAALARFSEICDASELCLPGVASVEGLQEIDEKVPRMRTPDFGGEPDDLTRELVDDQIAWSMQSAADWELLAAALNEGHDGDGSTLAALIAWSGLAGDPPPGPPGADDDDVEGGDFEAANFLIYCADLGPFVRTSSFCDDMPASADRLEPVTDVDLDREVLVIGTEFDPLTPGYHAAEFASRLGDAVWITWEGVGHTAFPGWTRCIDDVVVDQFLGRALPESGLSCAFVENAVDDAELADGLFGFGIDDGRPWLAQVLDEQRVADDDEITCIVETLVVDGSTDHEVVAQLILGVESVEAGGALARARAAC